MAGIRMPKSFRSNLIALSAAPCTAESVAPASAQSEGGLYGAVLARIVGCVLYDWVPYK